MSEADLDYIRNYYKVEAFVGRRIKYGDVTCEIVGAKGAYLVVRRPEGTEICLHPTWKVDYL